MICAGAIFSFTIGSVGDIVQDMYKEDDDYLSTMSLFHKYMQVKGIPKEISSIAEQYLIYIFENHSVQEQRNIKLLSLLTTGIQEDIKIKIYRKVLHRCKMF